jgi:hypothetical protein
MVPVSVTGNPRISKMSSEKLGTLLAGVETARDTGHFLEFEVFLDLGKCLRFLCTCSCE